MRGEKLHGDKAIELEVLGFVDDTHSTLAQFLEYLVMRNCLTDHGQCLLFPLRSAGIM